MNGVIFRCPECETEVLVMAACIDEEGRIILVGNCDECDSLIKFFVDAIISQLRGRVH